MEKKAVEKNKVSLYNPNSKLSNNVERRLWSLLHGRVREMAQGGWEYGKGIGISHSRDKG